MMRALFSCDSKIPSFAQSRVSPEVSFVVFLIHVRLWERVSGIMCA